MTTPYATCSPDSLVGLAFPVIRVRYVQRGDVACTEAVGWSGGVRHSAHYDYALNPSRQAYNAAAEVWAKHRRLITSAVPLEDDPVLFVPGDLAGGSHSYTVVPVRFLQPAPDPTCRDCGEPFTPYSVEVPPSGETVEADRCLACADGMLAADDAAPVTVTHIDYHGAPRRGDAEGWVIVAANGNPMSHPYRTRHAARAIAAMSGVEERIVRVRLAWQ